MSELEDASHPVAPDAGSEICQNSKIEKGWKAGQKRVSMVQAEASSLVCGGV